MNPKWMRAAALMLTAALLAGCHRRNPESESHNTARANASKVFRFGHQHGGDIFLRARGVVEKRLAEKGYSIEYIEFPAGPQLLEALSVGSIDIGATGESPPIFSQAAGSPLAYVANFPTGKADSLGLLIPPKSSIRTLQDLKGKRIAFQKASSAHNYLIQLLDRAGLKYEDISPVYLSPPDARAAFDSGAVDAWAIWDPFLTIAQVKTGATLFANNQGIKSAGGFYLSTRKTALERPEIIKIVLEELISSSAWAFDHPDESSLLRQKATQVDASIWKQVHNHEVRTGILPITESVIAAQQTTADNYHRIGLLPKRINIREALLTPEQYARILPNSPESAPTAK